MLPFHSFQCSNPQKDYPGEDDTISCPGDRPVDDSRPVEEDSTGYDKYTTRRPRRNTVACCNSTDESSSSSGGEDGGSFKSSLAERRSKSWYSGLLESIKSNVMGETRLHDDLLQTRTHRRSRSCKMKKALADIIKWCPEENRSELERNYIQLIRKKMSESVVSIGICGEGESGRRTLLNILQHSKNHTISSADTPITFRLCPYVESSQIGDSLSDQFKHSLLSCSAYLCVVSCDQLNECKQCTDVLEMLLQRDKDIFNQRRALVIANKLDLCFTSSSTTNGTDTAPTPVNTLLERDTLSCRAMSISSTSTNEYLHYDRLHDHEDFEKFVKQKLRRHIKHNTGIEIPPHCIIPSILKWSQLSRDYHQGIEEGTRVEEQLEEWLDSHEPYRTMTSEVELMSNEELFDVITGAGDIEAWVEDHVKNVKTLKELSILSDLIHCIRYCIDKLQANIDTLTMKIENLESCQIQKSQLMNDLNRLYKCVSSYKSDATLFNSLMNAYDQDIKEPLKQLQKLAQHLIERFKEMSISKLNRLIHCNFEHMSVEALQETCELDIASFSRGATNKLKSVFKTVVFQNMHNVLPFRLMKENSQELTKLADHLLKEQTSLEMLTEGVGLEETHRTTWPLFLHEDNYMRMSCTSGLELYYPVTLDAVSEGESDSLQIMSSQLHPHFYSMLHFHSSTISSFEDDTLQPLKYKHLGEEVKDNFIKHCERYLTSDALKRKAVQFHMDIMSEYICNFLDKFNEKYEQKIENMNLQMNDEIDSLKRLREKSEINLKHIITLKVDTEMRRAELLTLHAM